MTDHREDVFIRAAELAEQISTGARLVVLDVRWSLAVPDGRADYAAGHIPTAQYADLEQDLSAPATRAQGRHPVPDLADVQAAVRRWGIDAGDAVVVYDDAGGMAAARAWWVLRWAGLESVRILDGALAAWRSAGYALDEGDVQGRPSQLTVRGGQMPIIDADAAAEQPTRGVLIDARAQERYRGEAEPVDSRAGHIPGAVNAPTGENLDDQGGFRSPTQLRERFAQAGVQDGDDVAVYCGSGVTATHTIAALASLGIDAGLFPGSWSQWSADASRAVATGSGSTLET